MKPIIQLWLNFQRTTGSQPLFFLVPLSCVNVTQGTSTSCHLHGDEPKTWERSNPKETKPKAQDQANLEGYQLPGFSVM